MRLLGNAGREVKESSRLWSGAASSSRSLVDSLVDRQSLYRWIDESSFQRQHVVEHRHTVPRPSSSDHSWNNVSR